ncbi:hypothetical protein BJ138DRAFT_1148957 [Hygrophoropsis aurantiaca]|uniref:Uncharacterized protein n=1 Tax=Hygrophoropsis aurantiaca TaxID=72124 RepID=A0ACB8AG21_9AGAM|nr:hypothetical protein BJ138DRAFT_1148957 [Hygrophoropsis aurantiaca]
MYIPANHHWPRFSGRLPCPQFVPSESTECQCGHPLQTRDHILSDCPIFEPHRHHLCAISRNVSTVDTLHARHQGWTKRAYKIHRSFSRFCESSATKQHETDP